VLQPDHQHGRTIIIIIIIIITITTSSCSSEDLQQLQFQIITPTLGRSSVSQEFSKQDSQTPHRAHFYVLLTAHLGIVSVNNQLDAQLFIMYVYFYSLHVSGSHVPIIRRINYINTYGICHSV